MTFCEFLKYRNVKIKNKNHGRIVKMFYPYITSVCGVPETLSKIIGDIIGVDFSETSIKTGCFNGDLYENISPCGIPDLYCEWNNVFRVFIYAILPKGELPVLKKNEYVLFVLSDNITEDIQRTAGRYVYMGGDIKNG